MLCKTRAVHSDYLPNCIQVRTLKPVTLNIVCCQKYRIYTRGVFSFYTIVCDPHHKSVGHWCVQTNQDKENSMGLTGVAVGSLMGLTTKLGSNALQKIPYMRRACALHILALAVVVNSLCLHVQSHGNTCCSSVLAHTLAATSRKNTTRT
jgi:hypothetical protein